MFVFRGCRVQFKGQDNWIVDVSYLYSKTSFLNMFKHVFFLKSFFAEWQAWVNLCSKHLNLNEPALPFVLLTEQMFI